MDAVAAVIAHEELAAADPGFTLAYLAALDALREQLLPEREPTSSAPAICPTPAPERKSAGCA